MKSIEKLRSRLLVKDFIVYGKKLPDDDPAIKKFRGLANELAGEIEAEIAEKYMEFPVDADGVPIRPGDSLESTDMDGCKERFTCDGFTSELPDGKGEMMPTSAGADAAYYANLCRHVEPDPIKELLLEMLDRHTDGIGLRRHHGNIYSFADEYAGRIRELMKEVDE